MSTVSFSSIFTNSGRSLGPSVSLLRTLASVNASCLRKNYNSNVVVCFCSSKKRTSACESWKRHVFIHTAATTTSSVNGYSYNPFLSFLATGCVYKLSLSLLKRRLGGLKVWNLCWMNKKIVTLGFTSFVC